MKITSNGKVRRTSAEWREILRRRERSGMSAAEFCREENLQLTSFNRWSRRLKESSEADGFVELTTPSQPSSLWKLEVTLPNGTMLRLQG